SVMANAHYNIREPKNEPHNTYAPGTEERANLKEELEKISTKTIEIPAIIGGKEVKTGNTVDVTMPHNHQHKLATLHLCGEEEVEQAIESALEARKKWAQTPWEQRVSIFKKAADLLAGPWRYTINAATMLGQSKNPHESEIDAVAE